MTLRNTDTQRLQLFRKSIQRFAFTVNLVGAGTLSNVLLELVNLKGILKRGGREHVLFHDSLQVLAQESAFFNTIEHALSKTAITLGVNNYLLPLMVDLGSTVNLTADDEFTLEVSTKQGWYADFDQALSSIEVEYRESIGVEAAIPFIKTKAVPSTVGRISESLGDNVTSITLLNTESSRDLSDDQKVYDQVILNSDKWNVSDNRARLLARRATQFESATASAARKENFRYVPDVELDAVNITIEMKGSNVVTTKNYIVYRSFLPTKETLARAQGMAEKHALRNERKIVAQIS